ncbi:MULTISPECIES: CPBP family intramembrane glutamic endopeptidase [unclassified Clostridium]|uniref:CPBP family intramembrane glutamic endopeptidase n=1 Tax=unclassified Clostridium TaxID=2614128 RepID=UPI003F8F8303
MVLIKKINDKMINLSKTKFIFTIVILNFIISNMFNPIINLYEKYIGSLGGPGFTNLREEFIYAIILAPLLETLIFQMGIIKFFSLSEKIKNNKLLLIIISAFFFGLAHSIYSILYMICAFIAGILLAYSFIVYEDKEKSGYWVTVIIHGLMNLITSVF